uniref:Uncharacterized protein n=1 Tax=Kalanchoe fedtschenkoi TaxID=63787 RepID=A0A7N0UEJ3_KALFE
MFQRVKVIICWEFGECVFGFIILQPVPFYIFCLVRHWASLLLSNKKMLSQVSAIYSHFIYFLGIHFDNKL